MCFLFFAAAGSAFAGPVNFDFVFTGSNSTLEISQIYTSNGATLTDYGFECSAPSASSVSTLSSCAASDLYQSANGVGLAGLSNHLLGYESSTQDFVEGMNLSDLLSLGVKGVTITFNNVGPGEAFAVLGYPSNPFASGSPIVLTNTKAWSEVDSATFDLNAQDDFLILISPCGAAWPPSKRNGPCGSYLAPVSLTASAVAPTPEPGTVALFATGLMLLGFATRKRWAMQRT